MLIWIFNLANQCIEILNKTANALESLKECVQEKKNANQQESDILEQKREFIQGKCSEMEKELQKHSKSYNEFLKRNRAKANYYMPCESSSVPGD